ncbi:MAG: hypothetical protein GXO29_00075 [Thermotogae bacterium]|nr:hypothetical protein [Thermotogota bacterium]
MRRTCLRMLPFFVEGEDAAEAVPVKADGRLFFVVMARDWPGLSDAVLAVIHDMGFNLSSVFGKRIEDTPLAIFIMEIDPESNNIKDPDNFVNEVKSILRFVASGSFNIRHILDVLRRKITIYLRIRKEVERLMEKGAIKREEGEEILREDGELMKFVRSRSVAYLEERSPETLAFIVHQQVKLLNKARREPEKIHVEYHTFEVGPEGNRIHKMAGYTLVGKAGVLTMAKVLQAFRTHGVVDRYRKEFITPDGLAVVRVEVDLNNNFNILGVARELHNLPDSTHDDFEEIAGEEVFQRMVRKFLESEYLTSKVPQFFSMRVASDFYRVAIVGPLNGESVRSLRNKIETAMDKHNLIVSDLRITPLSDADGEDAVVAMMKVQPRFSARHSTIRSNIKSAVSKIYTDIRNFDETLRMLAGTRLHMLYDNLGESIPRKIISSIFYSIEDDLRFMMPDDELIRLISHIFKATEIFMEARTNKGSKDKKDRKERAKTRHNLKLKKGEAYTSTIGDFEITTIVSEEPLSSQEKDEISDTVGELISSVQFYGNYTYTFRKPKEAGDGNGSAEGTERMAQG